MAREGIVQNVVGGVGDFIGGVGEHLSTGAKSVRDAKRAELAAPGIRNDQAQINQLIQAAKALDPADTEGQAVIAQKLNEFPAFQGLQGKLNLARQGQADRDIATKKIGELARAGSSAGDFISDELRGAIGKKITQSFADIGIAAEESREVTGAQKIRLSSLFSEGLKSLKKTSKGKLADEVETQAFADKFKADAAKTGASPSAAAALFTELHDEETGKRGVFRNDVLPKGSNAAALFGTEATLGEGKPEEAGKAFEKFVQVGTEDFPEDNTPKPRASLGIDKPADQQTMQELEQAAPKGLDIQAVAQQDPEAFKQVLAALRRGKTPSGKAFTIKDALEMMGQL